MYDSPLEWCKLCSTWVAIDQTFAECARERNCTIGECPLAQFLKSSKEPRPAVQSDPTIELR